MDTSKNRKGVTQVLCIYCDDAVMLDYYTQADATVKGGGVDSSGRVYLVLEVQPR